MKSHQMKGRYFYEYLQADNALSSSQKKKGYTTFSNFLFNIYTFTNLLFHFRWDQSGGQRFAFKHRSSFLYSALYADDF